MAIAYIVGAEMRLISDIDINREHAAVFFTGVLLYHTIAYAVLFDLSTLAEAVVFASVLLASVAYLPLLFVYQLAREGMLFRSGKAPIVYWAIVVAICAWSAMISLFGAAMVYGLVHALLQSG